MTPEEYRAYTAGMAAGSSSKRSPGRPRKVSPKAPPKPCPEGTVRHPKTKRCRKIRPKAPPKPCPEGKERNPKTGRCRRSLAEIAAQTIAEREKRAARRATRTEDGGRPLTVYQQHMKDTIAKLKTMEETGEIEPMTYRERFKAAVQEWREKKLA